MFTIRKSFSSVLRRSSFFKGYFRFYSKNPTVISKQVKIGTVITIDHNKVDEVELIDQNAVGTVLLINQYKIGDIEFVC